jgi:rhodanese-related sulfurtransferase
LIRSHEVFEKEHIPGAINIPHRSISQDSLAELSKAPLYVTYCDGIGCNASTKTAMKMLMLGFTVKELIGGLDWWKRDGYETSGTHGQTGTTIDCGCGG